MIPTNRILIVLSVALAVCSPAIGVPQNDSPIGNGPASVEHRQASDASLRPEIPADPAPLQDHQPGKPEQATEPAPRADPVETASEPVIAAPVEQTARTALPASEQLPLGQSSANLYATRASGEARSSRFGPVMQTLGALAVVIGLILILRVVFVKLSGTSGGLRAQLGAAGKAPSGVLFVLGRYPVSRGMSFVLLQLDQRVLLLSQTGAGFHTLAELTDADEVASIIQKVREENGESLSSKFTGMLRKFESDPRTIEDIDTTATAQPVRLRRDADEYDNLLSEDRRPAAYIETKPGRPAPTGEDELRSRINRMREYGT